MTRLEQCEQALHWLREYVAICGSSNPTDQAFFEAIDRRYEVTPKRVRQKGYTMAPTEAELEE